MVLDPKQAEGLSEGERKFLSIIDQYGWHVMHIAPRENSEDEQLWWSYSTGLFFHYQHPEVVIFNLDYDTSTSVVNLVGELIKGGGKIELEKEYLEFLVDRKCIFRSVDSSYYSDYFGWSLWFYEGNSFPVLQCFWSDEKGYYPWDPRCCPDCGGGQRPLFKKS